MTVGLGNSTGPSLWSPVWPTSGGVPYSSGLFIGYDASVPYAYQGGWLTENEGAFTTYSGSASSGWSKIGDVTTLCCWGSGTVSSPTGQYVSFPTSFDDSTFTSVLIQFQAGGNWAQAYTAPSCLVSQPGVGAISNSGFYAYFPINDPLKLYASGNGLAFSGIGLPFQWVAFGYKF